MKGQLKTVQAITNYVFTERVNNRKASLTLASAKTGQHFTYRLKASNDGKVQFVSVLTGPDNTTDYQYLGIFDGQRKFRVTAKSRISPTAPSALAFEWFARTVVDSGHLSENLRVFHDGRCSRCGRQLTVPESVETGMGPECSGRMAKASRIRPRCEGVDVDPGEQVMKQMEASSDLEQVVRDQDAGVSARKRQAWRPTAGDDLMNFRLRVEAARGRKFPSFN